MACCSRRKPVQEADQEPILNAPQANDDYSYSHTVRLIFPLPARTHRVRILIGLCRQDELTSADTTGMSYVPAANRKKGFADEFRDMYSRLSLSSWWRSKPGQKDGKHAPPSIQVHTPRTSQEKVGSSWTTPVVQSKCVLNACARAIERDYPVSSCGVANFTTLLASLLSSHSRADMLFSGWGCTGLELAGGERERHGCRSCSTSGDGSMDFERAAGQLRNREETAACRGTDGKVPLPPLPISWEP
eukprot:62923-Rhodomonas_salina.2